METIDLMNRLLEKYNLSKINSNEEWEKIKISSKNNLRSIKLNNFQELRITSGSTGEPLFIFYSQESVKYFLKRVIKSIKKSGVKSNDIVLNLFAYGNFIPGSMYERGCLSIGIPILPLGAPNTYPKEKVIEVILKVKPTIWFSVPSYALGLMQALKSIGKEEYLPRKVIVAGEKLLESYINNFKELNVEVINHFGLTECPAIGISKKNNPKIIKVISDGLYIESIKNDVGDELVVTDLNNFSTPIIRYNTADIIDHISYNKKNKSIIQFELKNRSDDLIKLQGILTSKNQIIETISRFTNEFIINLFIEDNRDIVELTLPNSIKNRELEILCSLEFIRAKKKIIYQDIVDVPKTSSHKLKNLNDKRK